ncbi:MAG: hypothetical protein PHE47_08745 [Oscillospiraceae bacterium]|nr:hypothetical protein [Oscillospiraceae bacterium]
MNNSILEKLQAALTACPFLKEGMLIDYTQEAKPCFGIFPTGEKQLSADWAGAERWEYDFTIQMTAYALQERERLENEIFAERFSRWAGEVCAVGLDLGDCGQFESLWAGQGHLLHPAQDGQTFVYELTGGLIYRRNRAGDPVRQRWCFGFGGAKERVWLECAVGIDRSEEREPAEGSWFYDLTGQKRGCEPAFTQEMVFSGQFCPEDLFQQKALQQNLTEEILWVRYEGTAEAQQVPALGGRCLMRGQTKILAAPQQPSTIQISVRFLSEEAGFFWRDAQENGSFLPEHPGT